MQEVLLKLNDVSVTIDKKSILDDISFVVTKAKIITIIGPNGSGKSTLARSILGIVDISKGEIWFKDGLKIGYMPQKLSLNPYLPIQVIDFLKLNVNDIFLNERLSKIIDKVKINHILENPLQKISGGEMQRVLLARALLNDPDLLILDEPTQGIDINGQVEFYKIIDYLRNDKQKSIIIISHDLNMVMKSTDYVICLNKNICCEGTVQYVHKHKDFLNLFGMQTLSTLSLYHRQDHN